ncbi:hypothetical protein JXQ31_01005 [candidate division KSB1 bacterium]|nr:hypothetical protein [candidate division KSB1 bacterium]
MNNLYQKILNRFLSVACFLFFVFCSGPKDTQQKVLVSIGDRVITVEEFKNRTELTPRPFYCRNNTERHKIIALNSLIAEKLFALEEGEKSELLSRKYFRAYIKGKKEQYMREELFDRIAREPVVLDSAEINKTMQLAGFIYRVEYYQINKEYANIICEKIAASPGSATVVFDALDFTETAPQKTVKFKDPDHSVIHQALYSEKLQANDVIGPLKLQDNQYIVMKIKNVLYSPALSESEAVDRMRFVKERLVERKSIELWNNYIMEVMRNKDIEFVPQTTLKMAELYSMKDLPNDQQEQMVMKKIEDKQTNLSLDDLAINEVLMGAPFFKMDNKVWTVAEFRELLLSHPLVFRKPTITPDEYLQQFKLAIVDLMRDHYLNQEAYAKGIDKLENIKRNVEMWQDSYVAKLHREQYLKSLALSEDFDKTRMSGTYTYIDEYADSMQKKYSRLIEINMEKFNKIELTQTDMFSIQKFVPYPLPVPPFPKLCVDDKLDYVKHVKNLRSAHVHRCYINE